jgi:hypothetical protein
MAGSLAQAVTALRMAAHIGVLRACSAPGRASVMRPSPPCCRINTSLVIALPPEKNVAKR